MRAAETRQFLKAVKIHKLDFSVPILPQKYDYQPRVPMSDDECKATQQENWRYAANQYHSKLGLSTSPLAHDTRGDSSSSGAKRKQSKRRRGDS